MRPTSPPRGILLALLAAALWGTTGAAQQLSGASLDPLWFGSLRLAVAALFFAAVALGSSLTLRSGSITPVAGLHSGWAMAGAGLCMAAYNLTFFAGIRVTGVALGTAIALGSGPVWTGLLQAVILRRWPAASWWLGTLLAAAGAAMMAGVGFSPGYPDGAGVALCLLSGLSYAGYSLLTKWLAPQVPASTITLRAFAVAAAFALAVAAWQSGPPALSARDLAAVLYVGVFTAGVAYLLFSLALLHISAATGVTIALVEPVVACILAATLLGESLDLPAWIGLALVLQGVLVVVRAELGGTRLLRTRACSP